MRIGKRIVNRPSSKIVVFPRADGWGDIALEFVAVCDRSQFDAICPAPKPPMMLVKGGGKVPDFDSDIYKAQQLAHSKRYTEWMMLKTLKSAASVEGGEPEDIEWSQVKMDDPSTWHLFEEELKQGFSEVERMIIIRTVMEVNSMNESMLEEARQAFLLQRQSPHQESTSQTGEQGSTPSSEPASDSE